MNFQALLAGQQVAIEDALELTDNFVTEFPSPNPTKTQIENIKLWNTGDEYDGYKVYKQQVQNNGLYNPIPFEVTDLYTNEKIYNGFALPYADSAILKQDGEGNSIVLPLTEEEQDFDKICESVHLRGLNFTNADFEIIYCVVEQPDTPQDAAYWLNAVLYLVTLFITVVDITQDGIRLFSADISGAQATAAILGITLKGLTLLFLIYELIANFIVPIRKYFAIKVRTLLERAFDSLGYGFQSSILSSPRYDNLVYLAATQEQAVIQGNPTNIPVPDMTLVEFMSIWAGTFNAKFKPMSDINNTSKQIYFENISFFWQAVNPNTGNQNSMIIPKMQNNGEIQLSNIQSELHSSYSLEFTKDATDMGMHKNSKAYSMTADFSIGNTIHQSVKALQNSKKISIPVSLAAAKGGDSFFQSLFNTIYDALSFIIGNIDKGGDRKNMLLIPTNSIGVDKIFISDGGNLISTQNSEILNAKNIYEEFHRTATIIGGNQWVRISQKASFVEQPRFAKQLFYWNVCQDSEGRTCVVTKFTRNIETKLIEIEYRYQEDQIPTDLITEKITVG